MRREGETITRKEKRTCDQRKGYLDGKQLLILRHSIFMPHLTGRFFLLLGLLLLLLLLLLFFQLSLSLFSRSPQPHSRTCVNKRGNQWTKIVQHLCVQ